MKYIKEYKLFEAKKVITDRDQIIKDMNINIPMPKFDRTPNTEINGEPTREITKKELDNHINYFTKIPVLIYKKDRTDIPDSIEYNDYDDALKISLSIMIGTWIENTIDFINNNTIIKVNGINYIMK